MSVDAAAEKQFGPYLVYERLGVGGMATVHRALEQGPEGFERTVALKRLLPHLAEDASFIKSFVREAKLASILNHVNIVQIYELGRVGTEYFISMEYIDGRDLRRILRHARKVTGPPPIHITVGLMLQLCDALDYAHNKVDEDGHPLGLVHRDISPSNLIVTSGGHLKIIDFGIAKAQSSQLRTQTGRVKGKLAYMAPEAVSGSRDLDARSDIWACGVILHELLCARPLFASKNEYQTLLKVQRGDIMPPSTFNQACPPELDAIVFRALARDADQRYATAADMRDALHALKRQYSLQTGYRDIAGWLEWAFGLEPPASFSANPDSSGVSAPVTPRPARAKTPRPARNTEEEEAVELVWGGGNVESEDGPVVLDDVPDVSQKHRARRDTDDAAPFDDIPTPLPSHGTMPSIYGTGQDVRAAHAAEPPIARGADPRGQRRSGPRTIPRSATGPHQIPRTGRTTSPGFAVGTTTGPVQALDAPLIGERIAAQRARDHAAQVRPRTRADSGEYTTPDAQRMRTEPDAPSIEDPFAAEAAASLAYVPRRPGVPVGSDDTPTPSPSGGGPPNVPIVRFARSPTAAPPSEGAGLAHANRPSGATSDSASARAAATARTAPRERAATEVRIGESIAARAKPRPIWLYAVAGVLLVGGTATAVMMATRGDAQTEQPDRGPAPAPARDTGTVRFVTEPPDAEIRIAGELAHAGSPWSSELRAGTHQIEIHRSGYKAWLTSIELSANETQTLRVVLEPLTNNVGEATLTITSVPSGLEVVIDGQVQAQRTPYKSSLEVGVHLIALRQHGIELWQQRLTAHASTSYEFNPSFTAEKQRERARPAVPRPAPASESSSELASAQVRGDPQDPSPTWIQPATGVTAVPAVVAPSTPSPPTATTSSATAPVATKPPSPAPPKQATTAPPPRSPAAAASTATAPAPATTSAAPAKPAAPPPSRVTTAAPASPAPPRLVPPKIVPPSAVKKVSGDTPSIEKFKTTDMPSALAAKVCIDEAGKVTFAEMVTKVDRRVATDLTEQLHRWRYAAFVENGVAIPACFVVTFRAK